MLGAVTVQLLFSAGNHEDSITWDSIACEIWNDEKHKDQKSFTDNCAIEPASGVIARYIRHEYNEYVK